MRDRKVIVCPCEDVTLEEIDEAVHRGYRTMEEVKRLTGATTGPCQGKVCLHACVARVAAVAGSLPDEVGGITHRPPARALPLHAFASEPEGGPP